MKVLWRIFGPNSPNMVLENTNDISQITPSGTESVSGSLVWETQAAGEQSISLYVKPYKDWEIQKTYVIVIYDIQGFPASSGNGEPDPKARNFTLTVRK